MSRVQVPSLTPHGEALVSPLTRASPVSGSIGVTGSRGVVGSPTSRDNSRCVLTRAERYELQQLLAQQGYDIGEPDGRLGPRSRNALRAFQTAVGAVPDGFASATILDRLRAR